MEGMVCYRLCLREGVLADTRQGRGGSKGRYMWARARVT